MHSSRECKLGVFPKKTKMVIQKDFRAPVFIAALFIIASIAKQPMCLWMDEGIKEMWYIHTREHYSAIKKKEMLSFATTWMGLILSEIIQRQMLCHFTYMWNLKTQTQKKRPICGSQRQEAGSE